MIEPGRSYSAVNSYRFGFNGKENDNEVKGDGNEQDYGMRVYDTRLGRFLSMDPITKNYPQLTPYQFASNSPIQGADLDGLELKITNYYYKMEITSGKAKLTFLRSETHQVHDGGWFGWKNLLFGHGHDQYYWPVRDGKETGIDGWLPANSLAQLQASADYTARFEAGDKETIKQEEQRQTGKAVAFAILSKGLGEFGDLYKGSWGETNTTSSKAKEQVGAANGGKFGGRTIIVDENLSPTITTKLQEEGYNVKNFAKGTSDAEILDWAKKNNGAVLTNNIKDFKNRGVMTIEVPVSMTSKNNVDKVVSGINTLNRNIESHGNGVYNNNSNLNLGKDATVPHK